MASERVPRVESVRRVPVPDGGPLLTWRGIEVRGGFGSDLALDPHDPRCFFLLSDRGPNFDTAEPDQKGFALPGFVPRLASFRLEGTELVHSRTIAIRDAAGKPLSGLPHPPGAGATGETAVSLTGESLPFDPAGVDPEGLAAMPDGSFWIADEYGPQLLHLDPQGRVIEGVRPAGTARELPAVLATRRPNRGLEALTLLPDGRTIAGITQSSLENPSREVRHSSVISRLLTFDTLTGETRQYLYPQEAPGLSNSALCALSASTLLVIEHDARYPREPGNAARVQRVYSVDLGSATDVSDPEDDPHGLRIGSRTLEQLTPAELAAAGIEPLRKRLVLDLLALGYPHNKPEGLAILGDRTLVILNDDDFGIESDGRGGIVPKILPASGEPDANVLWFVTLAEPPR